MPMFSPLVLAAAFAAAPATHSPAAANWELLGPQPYIGPEYSLINPAKIMVGPSGDVDVLVDFAGNVPSLAEYGTDGASPDTDRSFLPDDETWFQSTSTGAVDGRGDIYVASAANLFDPPEEGGNGTTKVLKRAADGTVTQVGDVIGSPGDVQSEMSMAIGADGRPYLAMIDIDTDPHGRVYTLENDQWTVLGGADFETGIDNRRPLSPYVALGEDDSVYVATGSTRDGLGGQTVVYHFNGTSWEILGGTSIGDGVDSAPSLLVEGADSVYAATLATGQREGIAVFHFDGTSWSQVGSAIDPDTPLYSPRLARDGDGTLYVSAWWNGAGDTSPLVLYRLVDNDWVAVDSPYAADTYVNRTAMTTDRQGRIVVASLLVVPIDERTSEVGLSVARIDRDDTIFKDGFDG